MFVLWLRLCLEVESRMGTKNQVGVLVQWSQHWVPVSPKAWWVLRASSESWGCWAPLSLTSEECGLTWIPNTILIGIDFHKLCYNLLPFCSCLGNYEQLDTSYVNRSWIFITILGNIRTPFLPTPPLSSSIKNSFGLFFHRLNTKKFL